MNAASAIDLNDHKLRLPSGDAVPGHGPVVILGPNGSGKTRKSRELQADTPVSFVNAFRNTRVALEIQASGLQTAKANNAHQLQMARSQHWEIASDFDSMLAGLLAGAAEIERVYVRAMRLDPGSAGEPPETPLSQVEGIWGDVFPGRTLGWADWRPLITNSISDTDLEYSGQTMSDGEKAALYLAARVFTSEPGVLVVDEPETHLHSLLAVRLWNALEEARDDIRFVYVTHDLTFALSRRRATYVLAHPVQGLSVLDLDDELPASVATTLLGAASLSFYARRLIFCEGDLDSFDYQLYTAWFDGPDTVIRPVEGYASVLRSVEALGDSRIAESLEAVGIIDRDYHPDRFLDALPNGVVALPVHEIESLFAAPKIVAAVAKHLRQDFDEVEYLADLRRTITQDQRHQIIVRRWRSSIEPLLAGVVAGAGGKGDSVDDLLANMPNVFDQGMWTFSPIGLLEEERLSVEAVVATGDAQALLAVAPGKQMLPVAARAVGLKQGKYVELVVRALGARDEASHALHGELEAVLAAWLPSRVAT